MFSQGLLDCYHDALLASYYNDDGQSVNTILNQVEWNQDSVESFQSAIHSTTICVNISVSKLPDPIICPIHIAVYLSQDPAVIFSEDVLPQAVCLYEPLSRDCLTSGAGKLFSINMYNIFFLCVAIFVL